MENIVEKLEKEMEGLRNEVNIKDEELFQKHQLRFDEEACELNEINYQAIKSVTEELMNRHLENER